MSGQSKSERAKFWLKEYLKEFKEYSGTLEELAQLSDSSPYIVKKIVGELEEEGFLKSETKRGKGLILKLCEEPEQPAQPQEPEPVSTEEPATQPSEEKEEKKKKKEKKKSLQDQVLTSLIGKEVVVFLISGTRLEGTLLDFDNFTLSLTAPKGKSLVYKHAVATILFD